MKKIVILAMAMLMCGTSVAMQKNSKKNKASSYAKAPADMATNKQAPTAARKPASQAEPTQAEQDAYNRVIEKLIQRYEDLGVHELITEALQEIADENRDDFEVVLKFSGIDDPMAPGNTVLPFGPVYFRIQ